MAEGVISSFDKFAAKLSKEIDLEKNSPRITALKHHFSKGGVVSVSVFGSEWPKLLYPNKAHLRHQLSEKQGLRRNYAEKMRSWKQKYSQAQLYHLAHNVKKLKEPLYWKHLSKTLLDRDYRKDVETVKLPAHLVSDKRWKPMIETFVNNIDYRKQLAKTVEEGIVYKDSKKVARFADDLQAFRMQQSGRQIQELEKKLSELDTDIETIQELMKWASF